MPTSLFHNKKIFVINDDETIKMLVETFEDPKSIFKNLIKVDVIERSKNVVILWGGVGKYTINIARLAILIEDENLFIRQNWITQRNTRGYGTTKNYMSAREDFLFLTKTEDYIFNIPYSEEKSTRKDFGGKWKRTEK